MPPPSVFPSVSGVGPVISSRGIPLNWGKSHHIGENLLCLTTTISVLVAKNGTILKIAHAMTVALAATRRAVRRSLLMSRKLDNLQVVC